MYKANGPCRRSYKDRIIIKEKSIIITGMHSVTVVLRFQTTNQFSPNDRTGE